MRVLILTGKKYLLFFLRPPNLHSFIIRYCICVTRFPSPPGLLRFLCPRVKKQTYTHSLKEDHHSLDSLKQKISALFLILILFLSFFFLYSNPCFSLSLSLFFTIFTDNTLKRSFVFKKQTEKETKK